MGFFKKIFGNAVDDLKKSFEDSKNEMLNSLNDIKNGAYASSASETVDDDDDDEPRINIGTLEDGVLTISESFSELDDESLEEYKCLKKIVFPASLKKLDSYVISDQEKLEDVDFSKVTQLKEIPDDFISGETCIKEFVIPQCVSEVGEGFLGECGEGTKVFVPASVRKLGYINGNNNNDQYVYLFAPNLDISDVEQDIKTLYVLPELYGYYAKQLKECDSEARLREMPEDMLNVYANSFASELAKTSFEKPSKKSKEKTATPKATKPVETTPLDGLVQQIKEQLQSLGLSSFVLYGSDYEGDREYEEVEQLGDEGLLESSSEYAINYNDSYDGNSSVYTKVRKIEIQESGVTFDIEEIYEDNDGNEESRGFHEAQTIDRILESCNRDAVERGLGNILTYLDDETLIKLNKNTENEAKPEPVLEPKPEPEAETKVEVEQKEEPIENGGLFSARLEAMIAAALQDGVLTDKERELLKRRVEKEGEDWDEVEMIVEARLAEMNPVASTPSSRTSENNTVSKDTTPQDNKNTTPQDVSSKADNEYPETILEYKKKKIDALRNAQSHKNDSEQAKQIWRKAVSEIKMIDTIIRDGVKSVDELKLKLQKEQMKLQMEELAKEKEQMKLQMEEQAKEKEQMKLQMEEQAEMKPTATVTQVSQTQVQPVVMSSVQESPYLVVNGKEYKDALIDEIDEDILTNVTGLDASDIISVTIPSSVKGIKKNAFFSFYKLKELVIPSSVERIEDEAFGIILSDMSYEKLHINCPIIPENAFNDAPLKEVILGENVKEIDAHAFANCDKLSKLSLPKSLKEIGEAAFVDCSNLQIVDMSQCTQLEEIGMSAFGGCSSAEFVFPEEFESLKCIDSGAFENCKKITSFPFSKALNEMKFDAFEGCSNLQILDFSKCTELWDINYGIIYGEGLDSLKKIILPPSQTEFNALCVWGPNVHIGEETNQVEVDISHCNFKEVGEEAFQTMDMKEIVIPDTVETIEINAFDECENLKTIVMPAALKEIKAPLGSRLEQLKKVDFSKVTQLRTIPKKLFDYGCDKLKELMIPNGVTEIEDDALLELRSLKKLFLPPSLTTMGDFDRYSDSPSYKMNVYCYSPRLEALEPLVYGWDDDEDEEGLSDEDIRELGLESGKNNKIKTTLYVLPQYVDAYTAQRDAECIPNDVLTVLPIPDEYLYFYDN